MSSILVIGSLNTDICIRTDTLPKPGETIIGSQYTYSFGGKGANQAYAARKAGADVILLGYIGEDKYGRQMIQALNEAGICTEHLGTSFQQPTGTAFVLTDRAGANSIVVISGANTECSVDYILEKQAYFSEADCILLQLEIPLKTVCQSAALGREAGKTVILNPAPALRELPQELYENVDIITPNETELSILTGCKTGTPEEIRSAAEQIIYRGIPRVIVTLGSRGAMIVDRERAIEIYGRCVPAVDSTGAGDCFNGVLAVALAEKAAPEEAAMKANAAAAISVTRRGAMLSMPTRQEIEAICAAAHI